MSVTPTGTSPDGATFIRAGGGVGLNPRKLASVLVWICVAGLLGIAAYLGVSANRHDSRLSELRSHGVAVTVTVTGCTGISSGVGMGIEYWQCRGSFGLAGSGYTEVINGSRKLLDRGQQIPALVVAGHPDSVTTAQAVRNGRTSGSEYVIAGALAAVGVLLGACRVASDRRRRCVDPAPA